VPPTESERAGVAKASLDRLFGSKENLVGSYLANRREHRLEEMRDGCA
jgi:AcrR family transcriptional regulator